MENFYSLIGAEVLYDQFVRHYAMRERVNDITKLKVFAVGDIELPRNSLFHYMPAIIGEVGPLNNSPFLNTYPGRINMFFDWDYQRVLEKTGIKIKPITQNQIEVAYFKSHFAYNRARVLDVFLPKEIELLVNNLAPSMLNVVYMRRNIFTGFVRDYNERMTLLDAVNKIAEKSNRHQFFEIKLPNTWPSYQELKLAFTNYKKFFDESGEIKKFGKEALRIFHANKTYWLLDLYALLLGHENTQYSIFSKLSEKAKKETSFVFTYNGKCVIANIQTLLNLMGYADKEGDDKTTSVRVNHFKRFYINLISMVTNVELEVESDQEDSESKNEQQASGGEKLPQEREHLDTGDRNGGVADVHASNQAPGTQPVRIEGTPGNATPVQAGQTDVGLGVNPSNEINYQETPDDENENIGPVWGEDIPDEVFDRITVEKNETITAKKTVYSPTTVITRMLEQKAREGKLTNKEKEFFTTVSKSFENIEVGGQLVSKIIDIKPEDMMIKKNPIMQVLPTMADKSVTQSRTHELTKDYLQNVQTRNLVEMFTYVQNGGICLTDLSVEKVTNARSKYDVWTMDLQPIDGNRGKRHIRIPRIQEDGTFLIDGVRSYFQIQRMEKPIRKISPTSVQLTSYYDKPRIIIERSQRVVDRYPRWLRLRIINAARTDKDIAVVLGKYPSNEKGMCYYYSILASRFKEIHIKGLALNFDTHSLIGDDPKGKALCNEDIWVVGKDARGYITIDSSGMLAVNGAESLGYIEHLIGIETRKAPLPLATMNINGYKFPVVVVLSYWMGFNNLLKTLGVEYRTVEPSKRPELEADEFVINFSDERLIFNRRDDLATMILSGLDKIKGLINYSRSYLDDPNVWFPLMDDPKIKPTHFREMTQIFDMFIDPITKRLLEKDKHPTVMNELVITALKMLLTEYAPAETEITEQRFVGYERFAGHVYREICRSVRQFRNKPVGSRRTFDLNPESVMLKIITDSSRQAVEEVNPIHQLKQQEEVTYGGTLGRAERAMVRRTRGMHPNYVGIISEAGKDSGKVGFVSYLTTDAKLVDLYGNVDVTQPATKSGLGSVTMNSLYGTSRDDTKRTLFAGVQRSQLMATVNYRPNPIRMSYDTVIAHRTSELYSSVAKQDGKVIDVDPEHGFKVQYKDGSVDSFGIGLYYGKGGGEFHRHNKVTDMQVGDTFKQGKILAWDDLFFERDPINPDEVIIKMGVMARIALFEDQTSFEDSVAITKNFAALTSIPYVKPVHFNIQSDQIVKMHFGVGDTVSYDDVICDLTDPTTDFSDTEAFAGAERYGIKQQKAGLNGVIRKIEVFYNGEIEDFTPETQRFIKAADKSFAAKAKYVTDSASNGNVGGNTNVGKAEIYPGTIKVDVYIEEILESTTADKLVIGNQMKGTIGYIYPFELKTKDGRRVDVIFSVKSILARMVLSLRDKMVCNELNNVYTHRLIEKIEGKTTWVL